VIALALLASSVPTPRGLSCEALAVIAFDHGAAEPIIACIREMTLGW
jgi:hypothetical protein